MKHIILERDKAIRLNDTEILMVQSGEIRFGPPLFDLKIDNRSIEDSTFLDHTCSSEELGVFIITEYIFDVKTKCPYTQLRIFDVKNKRKSTYGRIGTAIIKPIAIENKKLIFSREADGVIHEYELPIEKFGNWK